MTSDPPLSNLNSRVKLTSLSYGIGSLKQFSPCFRTMASQGRYKFTMHLRRKPELSEDEFHRHWSQVHVPIVNNWLARHGVTQYIQASAPR
jgi:hypothetical protein